MGAVLYTVIDKCHVRKTCLQRLVGKLTLYFYNLSKRFESKSLGTVMVLSC